MFPNIRTQWRRLQLSGPAFRIRVLLLSVHVLAIDFSYEITSLPPERGQISSFVIIDSASTRLDGAPMPDCDCIYRRTWMKINVRRKKEGRVSMNVQTIQFRIIRLHPTARVHPMSQPEPFYHPIPRRCIYRRSKMPQNLRRPYALQAVSQ